MRKLFFSCLPSEQGDLRKGYESCWGFTSQWGVIRYQHCSADMPFNPLTPEPEWLGHLLPASGGRASVLPLMQSPPLKLPFLQRFACRLQLPLPWSHATSLHGAEGKQKKLRYDQVWAKFMRKSSFNIAMGRAQVRRGSNGESSSSSTQGFLKQSHC